MSFSRILTTICSDNLPGSRDFYVGLLGCKVNFDSDWYVQLSSPENPGLEFGVIRRDHELVPSQYQTQPTGFYLTFIVPDVDAVYEKAIAQKLEILQPPKNEFYGQRRFLTIDPNGCIVDISSPFSSND